tara:strand:+ start:1288 stop:2454 length:1167 start_codon:yes stop_codon:yes gene_type:complete
MNYGKKALENLYSGIAGKPVQPRKHLNVLGEGTSEDHGIPARAHVGYKDPETGQWRFARASQKFINGVIVPNLDFAEAGSYMTSILKRGQEAGIIGRNETINSEKTKLLYKYVRDSVGESNVKNIVNMLPQSAAQTKFIANLSGGNFYEIANNALGNTNFKYDQALDIMRPAGEDAKTRGAAGPGEALLAFLFNGEKPGDAGDLKLGDDLIELKKVAGRIGKIVDKTTINDFASKFYDLGANGQVAGSLNDKGKMFVESLDESITLGQFLVDSSGVRGVSSESEGIFGQSAKSFLEKNNRVGRGKLGGSLFSKLVQWIAIIHLKSYYNAVLKEQQVKYLVVFEPSGKYAGFPMSIIENNNVAGIEKQLPQNIYFGPKNDEQGYQIYLK